MNVLRSLVIFFAVIPVAFSSSLDATDQENISQHFNAYVDEGKIPHISILAHKNGKEIYRHAHGHADIESKIKINKDSIFRIYSMSKPVTGVAIMQLVEQGKLRLADKVSLYIPGFKNTKVLNLEYQDDTLDNEISIFPHIQFSKELVNDFVFLQFGLRDCNKRNSLRTLSEDNQFIHSFGTNQQISDDGIFSQELKKTFSKEVYFLMKNHLSKNQYIVLNTSFSKINNILYFKRQNISSIQRFIAQYKDVNQLYASLHYFNEIGSVIALDFEVNYFNYFDEHLPYYPKFISSLSIPISLRDKLKISPNISFMSGRSTLTETNLLIDPSEIFVELEDYLDFDLILSYNYSKKLSFNFDLNNITGQKNELFHGYFDYGFNVLFGLKYSF